MLLLKETHRSPTVMLCITSLDILFSELYRHVLGVGAASMKKTIVSTLVASDLDCANQEQISVSGLLTDSIQCCV